MNAQETVRQQLGFWHGILDTMLNDVGEKLNARLPGSTCDSIGSIYAHMVFAEDGIVNGMFQGKPLLYIANGWEAKTGVQHPGGPMQTPDWASKVHMDLPKFQEYAKAVRPSTPRPTHTWRTSPTPSSSERSRDPSARRRSAGS
jgi:hypothetical protein